MYIVKKASRFRTIIDLLLVLVLSPVAFFLFELLDTIRGRSSETNLVKRMTKEKSKRSKKRGEKRQKKENLHTFNTHLY